MTINLEKRAESPKQRIIGGIVDSGNGEELTLPQLAEPVKDIPAGEFAIAIQELSREKVLRPEYGDLEPTYNFIEHTAKKQGYL